MNNMSSESTTLIVSTFLKDIRQLHTDVDRGAALERHKQVSNVAISKDLGIFFAEPVYSSGSPQIDWFTSLKGHVRGFSDLKDNEVNHVKFEIKKAVEKVDNLTEELRKDGKSSLAKAIEESIEIPSLESVFLVGDKIVLCDWGFVKDIFKPQKGILRKIAADFSEAVLSINVVHKSRETLEGVLVKISNSDEANRADADGVASFGGLTVGNTLELIVEADNYISQALSLTIDSQEVKRTVVFSNEMLVPLPDVSYDTLFVSDNEGKAISNKSIKLVHDKNRKAYKSDSEGLIQFESYNTGDVVQAKTDFFHSITPKNLSIEEEKDRYNVILRKRWWLLLLPLLALLLSFFYYQKQANILLPILTVYINGQGEVSVGSDFVCNSQKQQCSSSVGLGETNLIATPYKGYVFKEWKESCSDSGSETRCSFTIGAFNKRAIAVFEPDLFKLTAEADQRKGSIVSSIPTADAIRCGSRGSDCEHEYRYGEVVDLNVQEAPNYVFDHWSKGCNDKKNRRCRVTIESDVSTQAVFREADAILSVAVMGGGVVDITANNSSRAKCDNEVSPCSFTTKFKAGWNAGVKAVEKPGYKFVRWEGTSCNTSSKTCRFTLSEDKASSVVAVFERNDILLNVEIGSGEGSVISNNRHINCPSECSNEYVYGQNVTLRPVPPPKSATGDNYTFDRWEGSCSGNGDCSLVLNSAKKVRAHFRKLIQCSPRQIDKASEDKDKSYFRVMNMGERNDQREFVYSFNPLGKYHDELIFSYEGREFHNTGCIVNETRKKIKYPPGKSNNITIEVRGACKPGQSHSKTNTGWSLVVNCPNN